VNENKVYKLYLSPSFKFMLVFGLVVFVSMSIFIIFFAHGFKGRSGPPPLFGVFWVAFVIYYLFLVFKILHKIILHGDGLIEFISVVRQLKVQARGCEVNKDGRANIRLPGSPCQQKDQAFGAVRRFP
jgi:hypothetical protein